MLLRDCALHSEQLCLATENNNENNQIVTWVVTRVFGEDKEEFGCNSYDVRFVDKGCI